jgi:hypothetical protein
VEVKRLLISIPSGPHSKYDQQLAWWLIAVQVQSVCREVCNLVADKTHDIEDRLKIRKLGETYGVHWAAEQAELQWKDPQDARLQNIWRPMIPDGWSVAIAPVMGRPLAANRNQQARQFLFYMDHENEQLRPSDFDAVLFIDTDNVPNRQDLHALIKAIERDDVDIVGGVYCLEDEQHGPTPIVYTRMASGEDFTTDPKTVLKDRGLHELDKGALPTGCLLIKRRVFEKMWEERRVWFKDRLHDASLEHHEVHGLLKQHDGDPRAFYDGVKALLNQRCEKDYSLANVGKWAMGEDVWFCKHAVDLGFRIWVDTSVFWGHIKLHDNRHEFRRNERLGDLMFKRGAAAVDPKMTDEQLTALYRATMAASAVAEPVNGKGH